MKQGDESHAHIANVIVACNNAGKLSRSEHLRGKSVAAMRAAQDANRKSESALRPSEAVRRESEALEAAMVGGLEGLMGERKQLLKMR